MARIRTIKPEFWQDEKLSPMGDSDRLLFLALISMADDFGRLVDNVKAIEAFTWPHEDRSRDTREGLARLSALGRLVRGTTASGQRIVQIANWSRHQKVDKPSVKSCLPEIVVITEVASPRETLATSSRESRESLDESSRSDLDLGPTTYDRGPTTFVHPTDADAPSPGTAWIEPLLSLWKAKVGVVTVKRAAAALGPVHTEYGAAETLKGLAAYLEEPRHPDKPVRLEYFAADAARWIAEGNEPAVRNGIITPRGERISRSA